MWVFTQWQWVSVFKCSNIGSRHLESLQTLGGKGYCTLYSKYLDTEIIEITLPSK